MKDLIDNLRAIGLSVIVLDNAATVQEQLERAMTIQQTLRVFTCRDADDATAQGYIYRKPEYKPISIKHMVVVKEGTETGRSTVDIVLEDEAGQKYVVIVTGAMLQMIPVS